MNYQEIIHNYLKKKNNEDEVITFLKEQKKTLSKNNSQLNDELTPLIMEIIRNSSGKVKYHAILLISDIILFRDAKYFQDICKIAAENSKDKDGNIRHACFLLVKNLNTLMIAMPFINMVNSMSNEETNLIYESFRDLFYDLAALYSANDGNAGKSILRSLSIMLPKIYDMAKFYNDEKEMDLVNEIKEEIMIGVVNWN